VEDLVTGHNAGDKAGGHRVVLLGMRCAFTGPVLDALCTAPDIDLAAVVLPGRTPERDPMRARGVPLIDVPTRADLAGTAFGSILEALAPDVIVIACFPWRLPGWLLDMPPRGCLNLHPSLLPDGRGPEPVFWAFRRGLRETGVTLHLVDEAFDAGPIISQERVPIPDGATIPSLERTLAEIGAGLALDHLRETSGRPQGIPQPEEATGYAPVPRNADLLVPTSWDVPRAARFIHAAIPVYGAIPVVVLATGQRLSVAAVIHVEGHGDDPRPVIADGDVTRIRFATGTLTCRILREDRPLRLQP
jgi:methionyl-tRNA formyltransferase